MCLARPQMHGSLPGSNLNIGRVYEPCTCCDPYFFVYDQNEVLKWVVTADCCQCGLCCRNGIGRLSNVVFSIFPAGVDTSQVQLRAGQITKLFAMKELYTQADNFEIIFPQNATSYEKLMIIGNCLMLDYIFFENPQDNLADQNYNY